MLYACYDLAEKDEDFRVLLMKIKDRYDSIINGLHLKLALDSEFTTIAENFKAKPAWIICITWRVLKRNNYGTLSWI